MIGTGTATAMIRSRTTTTTSLRLLLAKAGSEPGYAKKFFGLDCLTREAYNLIMNAKQLIHLLEQCQFIYMSGGEYTLVEQVEDEVTVYLTHINGFHVLFTVSMFKGTMRVTGVKVL